MNTDIADVSRLGYVGKRPGARRDSDSWFTPPAYLDAVRAVLGRIDLDPFSSEAANLTVGAKRYYTEADDAFSKSWLAGSVFMNPPYGRQCRSAVEKFVAEFQRGSFKTGIALVNNATETRFFQLLLGSAKGVCFTNHRISFYNADGKRISSPTRGSVFFYFGPGTLSFCREFTKFGFALAL